MAAARSHQALFYTTVGYDIARANLEQAVGLPGTEGLDVAACLRWVDHATRRVAAETEQFRYQFERRPENFGHSWSIYRMMAMATVLQKQLGVHYRMETIQADDTTFFSDAANLFIHGIVQG
jgi:hypothetical protein